MHTQSTQIGINGSLCAKKCILSFKRYKACIYIVQVIDKKGKEEKLKNIKGTDRNLNPADLLSLNNNDFSCLAGIHVHSTKCVLKPLTQG